MEISRDNRSFVEMGEEKMTDDINAEKINRQLDDIRSKLKIHKQETLETLQSISQNFENVLYERESEVEIYLKYIYDDNGRNEISYGPKKFNVMYEGVSLSLMRHLFSSLYIIRTLRLRLFLLIKAQMQWFKMMFVLFE